MTKPGYWTYETTGVLRPAVEAYLHGESLTPEQIAAMRDYLRQWICAPGWIGEDIEELRRRVVELDSRAAISTWLHFAEQCGIDPL